MVSILHKDSPPVRRHPGPGPKLSPLAAMLLALPQDRQALVNLLIEVVCPSGDIETEAGWLRDQQLDLTFMSPDELRREGRLARLASDLAQGWDPWILERLARIRDELVKR